MAATGVVLRENGDGQLSVAKDSQLVNTLIRAGRSAHADDRERTIRSAASWSPTLNSSSMSLVRSSWDVLF
jgi:hypothetical protein